tara:strand:- start:264 stop:1337 length:1074 start_codon:yes stop_codon:yes gene_type:complete
MKVKTVKLAKKNAHKKNSVKKPKVKKVKKNPVIKKVKRADGITEYLVKKIMSDTSIKSRVGTYFPESHYSVILRENADVYSLDDDGKKELLVSFRKNVLPDDLCKIGIECLKKAAMKKHDNRGAAAGPLRKSTLPKYANDFSKHYNKNSNRNNSNNSNNVYYRTNGYFSKKTGKFVNNSLGNTSMSNIIGYFDKPDRNIRVNAPKCRETAFTSQQVEKWKKVVPLIQEIDKQFKLLIPDRHKLQLKQARQTPKFNIKGTSFSTVTINYNWRTALHTDKGDLPQGFGNLVVLEEGEYDGGYTGFPQYGVCVDVRHGDFLGMDVHKFHCNTQIKPITKDYSRLSLVCYLREKMIRCRDL